jgi:hypothetical protein
MTAIDGQPLAAARTRHHFDINSEGEGGATMIRRGTSMTDSNRSAATLARSLADIAEGGLPDRIRLEQAARIIVTARRAAGLAAVGALAVPSVADPAVKAVTEIVRHWDAEAVTALEYAEALPVAALERLLRAAPAWAAACVAGPDRLAA